MINFLYQDTSYRLKNISLTKRWINNICLANGRKPGEVNILFCSDEHILSLNRQYLQHDYYTDIITFDTSSYLNKTSICGDIVISVDTVRENSKIYSATFEEEMHRVIIHGILHLLGFDDLTEEQKTEMRKKENEALIIFNNEFGI